jgi:RNA polymerase sigma factor (sigma-70 family)
VVGWRVDEYLRTLEDWYEQYGDAVHRRCRRILGDEAAAWDGTQEVFVRAHRALPQFRGDGSVLSFLLTIADRYCVAQLRRQRVQRELSTNLAADATRTASPETLMDDDVVRCLLGRMDDLTQRIVVLRFFGEHELEEIAQVLGIARKTVQRKLERFYARARKIVTAWQSGKRI